MGSTKERTMTIVTITNELGQTEKVAAFVGSAYDHYGYIKDMEIGVITQVIS